MNPCTAAVRLSFALATLLAASPGWAQTGTNPNVSDVNLNTTGGTNALITNFNNSSLGAFNTAFGNGALTTTLPAPATPPPAATR